MNASNIITISIAVIVAVVSASIIANLFWVDSPMEPAPIWQYDDYKEMPHAISADGALELVSLYGVDYVHAKDVGPGSITFDNNTTESVTVDKAIIDVYYVNGQSNATYTEVLPQTDPSQATPYPAPGVGHVIIPPKSFYAMQPLFSSEGEHLIGNMCPSFIANYYENTGHKVLYIQGGLAGRSILTFQPGEPMYNRTVAVETGIFETGLLSDTDHYKLGKNIMIWIQGEADDAYMSASEYYDKFTNFWESYQLTAHPFDYCLISMLPENFPIIREADAALIHDRSDMYLGADIAKTFTVSNGLMYSDGLHYTQEGRNVLGAALADSATEYYTHQKTSSYNPELENFLKIIPLFFFAAILVGIVRIFTSSRN